MTQPGKIATLAALARNDKIVALATPWYEACGGWIVKDRGELRNFAVCG